MKILQLIQQVLKALDRSAGAQGKRKSTHAPVKRAMNASTSVQAEQATVYMWPEHDDGMSVVGESFYQQELQRIAGQHGDQSANVLVVAHLKPEADNPHDEKAVSVWIDGCKVGHLDRDNARSFRRRLSAKKLTNQITACSAVVMGGFVQKGGARASYGVELQIKPFD